MQCIVLSSCVMKSPIFDLKESCTMVHVQIQAKNVRAKRKKVCMFQLILESSDLSKQPSLLLNLKLRKIILKRSASKQILTLTFFLTKTSEANWVTFLLSKNVSKSNLVWISVMGQETGTFK